MSTRRVAYYFNKEIGTFYYGSNHPMKPLRVKITNELLKAYNVHEKLNLMNPEIHKEIVDSIDLTKFHTDEYIDFLNRISPDEMKNMTEQMLYFNIGEDCPIFEGLNDYCRIYTTGSILGAHYLNENISDICINWSGGLHHAKKHEASGFCYINDCVLGILELLNYHHRVLYVDIDIHHGDGVEEAFFTSDRVLTCSFHKYGDYFPGTGALSDIGYESGKYASVNFPLHEGMDDMSFEYIFKRTIDNIMDKFRPNAVVMQCGSDSLSGDRLGCFNLSVRGHGSCLKYIKTFNLPMLVLGGGGYTLRNVPRCWTYETGICLGMELEDDIPKNDYLDYFHPEYKLHIPVTNMENANTPEYLNNILENIENNLKQLNFSSTQINVNQVNPKGLLFDGSLRDIEEMKIDEDPDNRIIDEDQEMKFNKTQLLKQVRGFSSFLNNSTSYWKETFYELEKNICQCPDNQMFDSNNQTEKEKNYHENGKTKNNEQGYNNMDMLFTDKRNFASYNHRSYKGNNETYETFQYDLNKSSDHLVKSSNPYQPEKLNYLSTNALSSNYNSNSNPFNCLTESNMNSKSTNNVYKINNNKNFKNYNDIIDEDSNNNYGNFDFSSLNKPRISTNSNNIIQDIKGLNVNDLKMNKGLAYMDPKKNWTKEEDEILLNFVNTTNSRNWKKVAAILKTKTPQQCSYRFNKIYTMKNQKKFTRNEDILIIELIEKHGLDWNTIVKSFPERKKEQIEDRYFNKLNPALKRKEFEPEEDALLLKLHAAHGNNWSEIAKQFKDASITMLKNRYYCYLKKKIDLSGNSAINNNNNNNNNNYYLNNYANENNKNFNYNNKNFTNSYSENSEFNSFELSNSLGFNRNENRNSNYEENQSESLNEDYGYRNSSKSYDPVNYKTRIEIMNAISSKNTNELNKNKDQESNNFYHHPNFKSAHEDGLYYKNNLEKQNYLPLDYEEFLNDFSKLEKLPTYSNYESFNKDNFNNESNIIDNYYNSNIDCNSTSLLDLLDDDIFSIDFLGKNTTRNSGDSIFNASYNASETQILNSKSQLKQSHFLPNDLNEKLINLAFENSKNNSNYLNEGFNKNSKFPKNILTHEFSYKEEKKNLFEDEKMLIDDNEVLSVPQNLTKIGDYSPKKLNSDGNPKINFADNYEEIFNKQVNRESFSKTNSNEIKEKIRLIQDNLNDHEIAAIKINNFSAGSGSGTNNLNEALVSMDPINLRQDKKSDKYLIQQYKLLQEIYKKYKKYKNFKIKIKTDPSSGDNVNENLNRILEADKNLNEKSESLLNELINLRKDYKAYVKTVKRNKNLQQNIQTKDQMDPYLLRNSLIKQIDILMKLISAIKVKIDLIRSYNNDISGTKIR